MEEKGAVILKLVEKTQKYRSTGIDLVKLNAIDKSSEVLSEGVATLVILTFSSLFFIILNIGIAMWLGEILGKTYYGFFAVAAFYALVSALLYAFRNRWMSKPLRNAIITKALKLTM